MQLSVAGLAPAPGRALIDGDRCPDLPVPASALVGGDAREPAISAASVLAKVARDHAMITLDADYPDYGFAQHKGYGTSAHRLALDQYGATPVHRRSFAPVRAALGRGGVQTQTTFEL